ncbi:MAG: hypothetical protein H5U40_13440 [Polyangiaceae bacterium]|nr:hypothetical protein [Polyangiaceae bacterium]
MRATPNSLLSMALLASFALVGGCTKNIPNTDVPDSPENRSVVEFMEKYRKAIEDRNVEALLAMTHPEYLDDSGTPGGHDDVDYESLSTKLAALSSRLLDVRNYNIRYRRIRFDRDRVFIEYTYTAYFRIVTNEEDGARWARRIADHRAVLHRDPETDEMSFLSGL